MGKVFLLDCTLRDGGYINDWRFGREQIQGFIQKIAATGIEMLEVGFLKGKTYDPDRTVFPDVASASAVIQPKVGSLRYVAMLDMSAPIPMDCIPPRTEDGIDGIRVIFKKDKLEEAYAYCEHVKKQGYLLSVNFVSTDLYSDIEFVEAIKKYNFLQPFAMTIVDTFGTIKRKQFLRLAYLADNNMDEDITLCYHAHNNLQQAFGNAEALVELNLKRDVCIDACVFGMGRGAGNLNLELFAEHLNENYGTEYRIEPMLEIMDQYLSEIYRKRFWGYSLPLYLSATAHCHPNYAVYYAEKDSLTVQAFNELLLSISDQDKIKFNAEKAEQYYRAYQANEIDDSADMAALSEAFRGKRIVLLAPGRSLKENRDKIRTLLSAQDTVSIAVNFCSKELRTDYVFSSNLRRYGKISPTCSAKRITTSNMHDCGVTDYILSFQKLAAQTAQIYDNSGIMALRMLNRLGIDEVFIAGMDGYSDEDGGDYYDQELEYRFSLSAKERTRLIDEELFSLSKTMNLHFITPTRYTRTIKGE